MIQLIDAFEMVHFAHATVAISLYPNVNIPDNISAYQSYRRT